MTSNDPSDPPDAPQTLNPSTLPTPPPTYCQLSSTPILATSHLLTLAGQVGLDPATHKVPTDFESQVRLAYANVLAGLKAAGLQATRGAKEATPRDIMHVKHYIVAGTAPKRVGVESEDELTRVWGRLWMEFMDREGGGHRPPDTVVGVASLATGELLYECEVWAMIHA